MHVVMWNRKRVAGVIVLSIFILYILRGQNYTYRKHSKLQNTNAEHLWEFLADFGNSEKFLNPKDLKILRIEAESGNYENWKYSVHYTEQFPNWPYLGSSAVGHYSIKKNEDKFLITSRHETCILKGLHCANTESVFTLVQSHADTLYEENIIYKCPPLMSSWCHRTNEQLRNIYFNNMIKHFKIQHYS